jgi:anti-sigma regulatory factor (Ser/Thr protein kinase)
MSWSGALPVGAALRAATWQRSFAGLASQISAARGFPTNCLSDCVAADDAVTCLSELATNAVLHSNSRLPGGSFAVRAGRSHLGRVHVEVTDQGGPWTPAAVPDSQHGRGLLIVASLAADWGITGHDDSRTAWFEMECP